MLQALSQEVRQADAIDLASSNVTVEEICELITSGIEIGRYVPGMVLPAKVVAADLGVPAALLPRAFADLTQAGTLARNGYHIAVPHSPDERDSRARHLANRFLDQVAVRLYPPEVPLPGIAELARDRVTEPSLMRTALSLLQDEGWVGRKPGRGRVVLPSGWLLAPPRTVALPPLAGGMAGRAEHEIRDAVRLAYTRWRSRQFLPPEDVQRAWQEMRSIATHVLPSTPAGTPSSAYRGGRAVALVREAASAPLPDTALLGLWHTACLAMAIRGLLAYSCRRTP
ncbi:GntR family transcriptional regulator [Streptomyces sp. NBC_01443]|uniref:GntR family transcriptional regulator n=1 Tax=Streptomyces sp. NBC_01443 TaxID=2903868 RepID=UPI00225A0BBF|nr:GntR family transcriptional regulator [Streptomyces sp. NBC_01443]MCX4632771.1 GntR family transcriptional regulator [Streptomyces sp. NBC_01443]